MSRGKLYFGTATDSPELTDTAYDAILDDSAMFGQITPGNSMKWVRQTICGLLCYTADHSFQDATEPTRGTFTWTGADQIANLAKANGQLLRGEGFLEVDVVHILTNRRFMQATTAFGIVSYQVGSLVVRSHPQT